MNRDILGCAQTGTGKTASFTLPLLDILSQGRSRARMPRCVILEPTRELAAQVAENFTTYGKYCRLEMALLIGGVSFGDQDRKLDRGVDVLIATPGRLLDHCQRGRVILSATKILIIDEADRMLDMGFIPDVERLVSLIPPIRQTLMFSATMPKEIRRLADKFLANPKELAVDPAASAAVTIEQKLIRYTPARAKRGQLYRQLRTPDVATALVFCNRKRDVASLYRSLLREGFNAGALHGDMDQYKRMEWLEKFRNREISILVCSDVAARGLDIPEVSHVFNYDVPINAEDYIHRIGRTGRAGRKGVSITLAGEGDDKALEAIEKLIGQPIAAMEGTGHATASPPPQPPAASESVTKAATPAPAPRARRGTSGGRGRKTATESASPPATESIAASVTASPTVSATPATTKPARAAAKKPAAARTPARKRSPDRDRNTDDGGGDAGNRPFGQTDFVPGFLLRG